MHSTHGFCSRTRFYLWSAVLFVTIVKVILYFVCQDHDSMILCQCSERRHTKWIKIALLLSSYIVYRFSFISWPQPTIAKLRVILAKSWSELRTPSWSNNIRQFTCAHNWNDRMVYSILVAANDDLRVILSVRLCQAFHFVILTQFL